MKVLSSILVTEEGIEICVNEMHPKKAANPILVTEEGIEICANELHPQKDLFPITVTESVIEICVIGNRSFCGCNRRKLHSQLF